MKKTLLDWKLWLLASLTLGLAPFTPEPHLWGKLKWIAGGAEGMKLIDWWDTFMHGAPWVMLVISVVYLIVERTKKRPDQQADRS
ncbi:hypothetical protein [Halocola ammonii]